jgi:anti-sigma-K factor RskA
MRPEPRNLLLMDRLAAEFVLGTLRGRARVRFARWRTESEMIARLCGAWEQRLNPVAERARPIPPPPSVWPKIQRRLGLAPPTGLRWVAAAAVVALLAAMLAYWPTSQALLPPAGQLQWRVEIYTHRARLVVRSPGLAARPSDHDYELWALPSGGAPPVSLGVLPAQGQAAHALSEGQRRALARAQQVAVSIEPIGGSPTGQPTGPVVFVVPLRAAG